MLILVSLGTGSVSSVHRFARDVAHTRSSVVMKYICSPTSFHTERPGTACEEEGHPSSSCHVGISVTRVRRFCTSSASAITRTSLQSISRTTLYPVDADKQDPHCFGATLESSVIIINFHRWLPPPSPPFLLVLWQTICIRVRSGYLDKGVPHLSRANRKKGVDAVSSLLPPSQRIAREMLRLQHTRFRR